MSTTENQSAPDSSDRDTGIKRLQSVHDQQETLTGQLLTRRRRRRLDLRTLHGVARESAKIYRALSQGEILPAQAEVRSRVLRRHSEILGVLEMEKLGAQLKALESNPRPQFQVHDYAEAAS
jgi:hypothetical protein